MALKKFKIQDAENPNLVGIYDIEGSNNPEVLPHCGVVIDTKTAEVTHILRRYSSALMEVPREARSTAPKQIRLSINEPMLQEHSPAYYDNGVIMYQQAEKPADAVLFRSSFDLPPSVQHKLGNISIVTIDGELNRIPEGNPTHLNANGQKSGFSKS